MFKNPRNKRPVYQSLLKIVNLLFTYICSHQIAKKFVFVHDDTEYGDEIDAPKFCVKEIEVFGLKMQS